MQNALKYTLRRLTEALAELQETVRAAIQAEAREPAEVVEDRCAQARDDVFQEVLVWIKNGQLTSFLYIGDHERDKTNERNWESLPDGDFWSTVAARRILITGTATSNRHPRKGGTAYCRANEFDALAIEYIVDRRLKLERLPKRFRFRNLTRNRPTPGELDDWMVEHVRHWVKRDLTIIACRKETGATARGAAAAFDRLPNAKKLGGGKKL